MKTQYFSILILAIFLAGGTMHAQDKKLGQTGFQFLSVVSDAQGSALGGAMTSREAGSGAIFFNPACMAHMKDGFELSMSQNNFIADIKHNQLSAVINPGHNRYGVFGVMMQAVDYGEIENTVRADNDNGYFNTSIAKPTSLMLGGSYAKALSDKFSVGMNVKYSMQNLGKAITTSESTAESKVVKSFTAATTALDFGTLFRTGFRSVAFGVSLQNLSQEVKYVSEDFELPMTFNMGISANLFDFTGGFAGQTCVISLDAVHPRSYPEFIRIGADYRYGSFISLRGGFISNHDNYSGTFGMGVRIKAAAIDYAYTPQGVFDQFNKVQQFTVRFAF